MTERSPADHVDPVDAVVASMRPTYLARRREELPELVAAAAAGDLDDTARRAHRVAGSAATYGFAELSALAKSLEAACLEERSDDARALVDALGRHLDTL